VIASSSRLKSLDGFGADLTGTDLLAVCCPLEVSRFEDAVR